MMMVVVSRWRKFVNDLKVSRRNDRYAREIHESFRGKR